MFLENLKEGILYSSSKRIDDKRIKVGIAKFRITDKYPNKDYIIYNPNDVTYRLRFERELTDYQINNPNTKLSLCNSQKLENNTLISEIDLTEDTLNVLLELFEDLKL